ncbi:MAG: hypothetical protein MJ010_02370 [Paludibacteraceae bacterium]|nr:hypothetical protein [Paludibacteraceae bacterium]
MEENINQILTNENDNEIGAIPIGQDKQERPFSKLNRTLSESDLKSVGVQKILLSQMDDYEKCKEELDCYRKKYYASDKKCAEYAVKESSNTKTEALYSCLLAIGSAILGMYPGLSDCAAKWVVVVFGILSLGASLVIKFWVGNIQIEKK